MKKIITLICVSVFLVMSNVWASQVARYSGKRMNQRLNVGVLPSEKEMELLPYELEQYGRIYTGQTVMPAIYAYHCNNHDPNVQNCGEHTVPYGDNITNDVHFTHTWFQIVNSSHYTFTNSESRLIIEVYGKNGKLADIHGGPDWYDNGLIDLLHDDLAGDDGFTPNESIFFYFDTWMRDHTNDINPPYSAKLIARTKVPYHCYTSENGSITLNIHVGWEEIIENSDGQRQAKAGTLIDKETIELSPGIIIAPKNGLNISSSKLQKLLQ